MFRDYYHEIPEQRVPPEFKYIVKHIKHIIIDYEFDFYDITESVNALLENLNQKQIHIQDVQELWTNFHYERLHFKPEFQVEKPKEPIPDIEVPNQFNILKDSIRKPIDESKLYDALQNIGDVESDCLVRYFVKFDEKGRSMIQEKELDESDIQDIMSHPVGNVPESSVEQIDNDDEEDDDDDYFERQRASIKNK